MLRFGRSRDPGVHRLLPDRSRGRRKPGIGESTHGNAVEAGPQICLAIDRATAVWTKTDADFPVFLAVAGIQLARPFDANCRSLVVGAAAEDRSGAALTLAAMAHVDGVGLAGRDRAKLTTLALGDSLHRILREKGWSSPIEDIRAEQPEPAPLGLSIAGHERCEQGLGGGGGGADTGHNLLFDGRETTGDGGGGTEVLEEIVADL